MLQLRKEELEKIDTEGVLQLKELAAPVLKRRKELYQRYTRKRNPLAIMGAPGPEEQRGIPFEYYIATIVQGYLGKPRFIGYPNGAVTTCRAGSSRIRTIPVGCLTKSMSNNTPM